MLAVEDDTLRSRSHPRTAEFGVKRSLALLAGQLDVFHAQLLLRDHGRSEDRCAVVALRADAGTVLGPESVDYLWAFVAILLALIGRQSRGIDA